MAFLTYRCIHLNYFISISDDDLPGAHLLAEAKFSLQKIFPQMQKKFQISLERPNLRVSEDESKNRSKYVSKHFNIFIFSAHTYKKKNLMQYSTLFKSIHKPHYKTF